MTIPSSVLSENLRRDLTEKDNLSNLVQNLGALRKFKVDLNDHIAKCKSWPVSDVTKDAFRITMIGNFLQRIRGLKERGRIRLKIDLNTDFAKDNDQISDEIEAIIAICEGVAPKKKSGMPGQMAGVLPRRHSMSPNWVPKGVNGKDGADGPKGVNGERKRASENELTSGANGVVQRRPLGGLHQRRRSQTDVLVFWFRGQKYFINLKGIKNMQSVEDLVKSVEALERETNQDIQKVSDDMKSRDDVINQARQVFQAAEEESLQVMRKLQVAVDANQRLTKQLSQMRAELSAKKAELSAEIEKNNRSQTMFSDKQTALELQVQAAHTAGAELKQSLAQKQAELAALEESVTKLSGEKEDLKLAGEKEKVAPQHVAAGDGSKTIALDKQGNSASVPPVEFALNKIAQQKQALIEEIRVLKEKEVANSNETTALKQELATVKQQLETLKNIVIKQTATIRKLNEEGKLRSAEMLKFAGARRLSLRQVETFFPGFASLNLGTDSSGSPKNKSAANGVEGSASPAGGVSPVNSSRVEPSSDRKDSPRAS